MMNLVIESFNEINKKSFITDIPNMVRQMDTTYNFKMGFHSGSNNSLHAPYCSQTGK